MPQPANRRAVRSRSRRAAQRDAELAVLGRVHPADGARVPAAVHALELGDRLDRAVARLAPDRGGRVQQARQLDRRARLGELGVDRRREMLDVRDLDDARLVGGLDPDGVRAQRALDPPRDDPVLGAVLVGAQELLAEVIVDAGVGAAPRRARERDRRGDGAAAADEQLGAGADERRLRRADAEAEAGREELAQGAVERRRDRAPPALDLDLAREDHLLELAGSDPLHGALDRPLVVAPGGRDAAHRVRPVGLGSSGGSGCSRSPASRARSRDATSSGPARGWTTAADGEVAFARRRARSRARAEHQCRGQRGPMCAPRRGVEREAADPDRPGARREALGLVREPVSGRLGAVSETTSPKRPVPRDTTSCAAQAREREAVAVRLLPAEPAIARHAGGEGQLRSDRRRRSASWR